MAKLQKNGSIGIVVVLRRRNDGMLRLMNERLALTFVWNTANELQRL